MRFRLLVGVALTTASLSPAFALPPGFQAKADALLEKAYSATGPGAAVIVTEDGKTVYYGARGLADVEGKHAVGPDTVFRMGSITKQFSAAVMLQLVAEGKVSLDDQLSKFFPDFPTPGADATIAQILNHTVGVQSYTGLPGFMDEASTGRAYTTEELIATFKDVPSPSKPGDEWRYNNSGYVLVGAVIEKVTGKPWHANVDERLAKPLGLKTIRYGLFESGMPGMASGYTLQEGKLAPSKRIHMSVPHAAGALIGSVEDLAKWNAALHHGKVVPQPLYAKMIAKTVLNDGKINPYGFGLSNRDVRGRAAIGHGGGIFGFNTDSIYLPKEDLFVAVFANSDQPATEPGTVMMQLAALAIGDPFPAFERVELDPKNIEPLFGVYKVEGDERRFFAKDGKLFTQRGGGRALEVQPAGGGKFFYPGSLTWFEIGEDALGTPSMTMHHDGAAKGEQALRTGPIPSEPKTVELPKTLLARYVGSYQARLGVAKVAIADSGPMTLQLGAQQPVPIIPISETEFLADGIDAKVVFHLEGATVKRLIIHQGGRELPAERVLD